MAWVYSVPPYRLKERPPLDSLANGLGYFLLPLMMGYSMGGDPREMPARYYLLGLCVAGVHALATAADFDADRAAGHRTLAATFGKAWCRVSCLCSLSALGGLAILKAWPCGRILRPAAWGRGSLAALGSL